MSSTLRSSESESLSHILREAVALRRAFASGEALELLNTHIVNFSEPQDRARLLVCIGDCLKDMKKFDEALESFTQATRFDPANCFAAISLGMALAKQHRHAEAAPHFKRALSHEPNNSYALYGMVKVCAALGNLTEGLDFLARLKQYERKAFIIQDATSLLSQITNAAKPPAARAGAHHASKRELAEQSLREATAAPLAPPPASEEALLASFRSAGMKDPSAGARPLPKGDHRRAAQTQAPPPVCDTPADPLAKLQQQIEREPRNVGAKKLMADALIRAGREAEAIPHLQSILAIDTRNAPARQLLTKLEAAQPKPPAADTLLKRVFRVPAEAAPAAQVAPAPAPAPAPSPLPEAKVEPEGEWVDEYEITLRLDGEQIGQMSFRLPLQEDGMTSAPLELIFQTALAATLQNTATNKSRRLVAGDTVDTDFGPNVVPLKRAPH